MFFVCAVSIAKADVDFYVDSIKYSIEYPAASEARVVDYIGHATNLVIPSSVTYNSRTYTVTRVSLYDNLNIVNVTLPNSITKLYDGAFRRCSNLTTIILPNTLTAIGDQGSGYYGYGVFEESGITSINIPSSVTFIKYGAFRNCTNLQSVVLPDGLDIPERCFEGCTSLSSIEIHANAGERAFLNCTGLISARVDGDVHDYCFYGCTNLQRASIRAIRPSILEDNSRYLFYNCVNLSVVNLGYTYYIGVYMFENCSNIDTIKVLRPDPPSVGPSAINAGQSDPFHHVDKNTTIIVVPCNTSSIYAQQGVFRDFWNIIEECNEYTINGVASDPAMGSVSGGGQYVEGSTVTLTAIPNDGFFFSHWTDGNTDNPRTVTVTGDAVYTAVFQTASGIEGVEADNIRIYIEDGRIVMEGMSSEISVYNLTGRIVANEALPAGVYIVKIGNYPARKVVVIR